MPEQTLATAEDITTLSTSITDLERRIATLAAPESNGSGIVVPYGSYGAFLQAAARREDEALAFLAQVLRIAVPYFLAAAGGVISERVGIIALSLEGFMLSGAFGATLGSYYSGSPWIGLLCGALGGALAGLVLAIATIRFRADQVVSGIAVNLLVAGATPFFLRLAFDSSSNSPRVPGFGGGEGLGDFGAEQFAPALAQAHCPDPSGPGRRGRAS